MFPEQKFVVDHISKPLIRDRIIDPWKDDILMLAANKNVWCKISGMVTEADWKNNTCKDFHPYLDIVFQAFGTDRLMTGSDWPVCTVSREYNDVINLVRDYISEMPDEVREKILGLNCIDFYRLGKK
jgi:L-fuconolactonase